MQHQGIGDLDSRPTVGIVMRGFRRPDYDIWLSATEAAGQANLNVLTFAGQPLQSPVGYEQQANAVYGLINPEWLAGVVLLTSGLGLYVGVEGMRAFCGGLRGIPMVSVQTLLPGIPSILIDNYRGMREVVDHLIEVHGYRHIAFLRGPLTHRGARERHRAYVEGLEAHGIPLDAALVTPPSEGWDNREGIRRFLASFERELPRRVEAIVGTSASLAQQALGWLTLNGFRVPEDIALTGFDDFPHLAGVMPPLTTTRAPFDAVGREAISLLLAQMHGEDVPLVQEIPARLVVRQSCGCPSQVILRASLLRPDAAAAAGASTSGQSRSEASRLEAGDSPMIQAEAERATMPTVQGEERSDALYEDLDPQRTLMSQRDRAVAEITRVVADGAWAPDHPGAIRTDGEAWAARLVDALVRDLGVLDRPLSQLAVESDFLAVFRQVMFEWSTMRQDVTRFEEVISLLRRVSVGAIAERPEAVGARSARALVLAEDLFTQARAIAAQTANSLAAAAQFDMGQQAVALAQVGHILATVTDMEELKATLAQELPKLEIEGCFVTLLEEPDDDTGRVRLHFASTAAGRIALPGDGLCFQVQDALPREVLRQLDRDGPFVLVAESLFARHDAYGYVLFGVGPRDILFEDQPAESTVYDLLRSYISDALCGILLYDQAVRARQRAEEADLLKSRFLSMVSHELRTPLNLIVSVSEMLLWEQHGREQELMRIHASAQHLDGLIRDVLDLASSQVGQLRLVREPLDLRQVLEVVMVIGQQMALDKGLRWLSEVPDSLPKVWGDRTRLRQVALNLVSNAIRFTSEGEVRLAIECVRTPRAGEVRVSVSDTGIGVPPAEHESIFDEFRQSERTAARGYGGLGLGLAISRRLVEMHGGTIGVASSGVEGEGATFYFTLSTMDADRADPSASPDQTAVRSVLILSEASDETLELHAYLESCGYAVREICVDRTEAQSSPEAWLSEVVASMPSAVILGMKPASEYGWDMLKVLKENPDTQTVPVLFYALMRDTDSGSLLALDYLTKPLSIADLVQVLERQGIAAWSPQEGAGDVAGAGAPATILLVDDEPDILATHMWLLRSQFPDSCVLQAADGRQALELMEETRPDLVLLDLMMPEMNGFDVIAAMQEQPHLSDVPVVVLTAKTLTEQALAQLNQGVVTVLSKGVFSAQETLHHLEAALRRSTMANPETRKLVRRAMAYIHERYMEPIARKEIAAYVNLSARHLDRCFTDEIGITPMVYLNRFRLRHARRLLQSTALNISEVAAAVGFSDSSYFCRVFRRDLGMSPSDYRRMHA
ncbi:MAG: substrate-binding domain-containing protein [Anaerolineae bacterium]|nr:substrate-binding domain-containing protein [Anaerolineae bacterium]